MFCNSFFARTSIVLGLIFVFAGLATAQTSALNVTIGASTRTGSSQAAVVQCAQNAISTTNFNYTGLTPDGRISGLDYIDVPTNSTVQARRHNGTYLQLNYSAQNNGTTRVSFKHQEFERVCFAITPPGSTSQCLVNVDVISFNFNKNKSFDLPDLRQLRIEFGSSGQNAVRSIFNVDNDDDVDTADLGASRQALSNFGLTSIEDFAIRCPQNSAVVSPGGSQNDVF